MYGCKISRWSRVGTTYTTGVLTRVFLCMCVRFAGNECFSPGLTHVRIYSGISFFFYLLRFFSLFFLLLPFLLLFPFLLRTTTNLITRDGGVQQNTVQRLQRRRKNRVHISPVIGYYYLPTSAYLRPPVIVHDIITSRRPWLGDG